MTVSRWTTVAAAIVGGAMLATSAMGAQAEDRERVKIVQQALKDRGHDPGAVDGQMGPKTEAALRDYQQKEGLRGTGTADADTLTRLRARTPATAPSIGSSATGTSNDGMATETRQTK